MKVSKSRALVYVEVVRLVIDVCGVRRLAPRAPDVRQVDPAAQLGCDEMPARPVHVALLLRHVHHHLAPRRRAAAPGAAGALLAAGRGRRAAAAAGGAGAALPARGPRAARGGRAALGRFTRTLALARRHGGGFTLGMRYKCPGGLPAP